MIVPLDSDTPTRLAAVEALWSALNRRPATAATLTPQRRHRIKRMLRAVDARAAGASHRKVAEALFGTERTRAEPWKTSSLRDTVMRLARDGAALVDHGYRIFLRPN